MSTSLSATATDWREGRRLRAWELHEQGWSQSQIAVALGVTSGAVCQRLRRKPHIIRSCLRHSGLI